MIALTRGSEPEALRKMRHWRLADQRRKRLQNQDPPSIVGYDVARDTLYEAQEHRCCYCGDLIRDKAQPVEHFRPKEAVDRRLYPDDPLRRLTPADPEYIDHGYWWLAWTWENLLFSCHICNSGYKKTHFPIRGATLPAWRWDVGDEHALLIDPFREDPMDSIYWRPELPALWDPLRPADSIGGIWWVPDHKGVKGEKTVSFLGLRSLKEVVTDHVRTTVWPNVKGIFRDWNLGQRTKARRRWAQKENLLLGPGRRFPAATWDVLQFLMPDMVQQLPIPRPGRRPPNWAPPPPVPGLPDAPAGVGASLWLDILACGDHGSDADKDALLLNLCQSGPWNIDQLRDRLPILSPVNLKARLARLVASGQITEGPQGYRA